jgi:hypothetical protein
VVESAKATVAAYWAGLLGCTVDDLRAPGLHIGTFRGTYRDAWWLRRQKSHILSVPGDLVERIRGRVGGRRSDDVDLAYIEHLLAPEVRRIIGPCFLGYADRGSLRTGSLVTARQLGPADVAALRELADSCDQDEWAESGLNVDRPPIFGCFAGQRLLAAASYEVWGDRIAHMGVLTDLASRRSGHGRIVAACAASHALDCGLVVQWRALESNTASVALGTSLGCARWGSHYIILLSESIARAAADDVG